MKKFSALNYLAILAIITVIFGVMYATVQQTYRTAANDPQIQIARDINERLQQGKPIDNFFVDTVDIAQSLSTFVALFDVNGKPVRSSGYLDGKLISLPAGVFDHTKSEGEYEVTWQPQHGVRIAMVIVGTNASSAGFVACGRSLQEVEVREHNLVKTIFFGWIICIVIVLLYGVIVFYKRSETM